MNLFDVYPLFNIEIVKAKDAMYGTAKAQNTSTCTADMLLSPSVTATLLM